jgi:hypothetical protein
VKRSERREPSKDASDNTQLRVELVRMKAVCLNSFLVSLLLVIGSNYLRVSLRARREVKRVCMHTRWVDIICTYL